MGRWMTGWVGGGETNEGSKQNTRDKRTEPQRRQTKRKGGKVLPTLSCTLIFALFAATNAKTLQSKVGLVGQEPVLFAVSIAVA